MESVRPVFSFVAKNSATPRTVRLPKFGMPCSECLTKIHWPEFFTNFSFPETNQQFCTWKSRKATRTIPSDFLVMVFFDRPFGKISERGFFLFSGKFCFKWIGSWIFPRWRCLGKTYPRVLCHDWMLLLACNLAWWDAEVKTDLIDRSGTTPSGENDSIHMFLFLATQMWTSN